MNSLEERDRCVAVLNQAKLSRQQEGKKMFVSRNSLLSFLEATAHLYQITLDEYDTSFVVHSNPQALNSSRPKVVFSLMACSLAVYLVIEQCSSNHCGPDFVLFGTTRNGTLSFAANCVQM